MSTAVKRGSMHLTLRCHRTTFALLLLAATAMLGCQAVNASQPPPQGGPAQGDSASFVISPRLFGLQMNSGIVSRQPWPAASFSRTRLWNSETQWGKINTAEGVYDWTILDKWLAAAQSHQIGVLYTFGYVPAWASSNPTDPNCDEGLGACDPPNDLNADGSGRDQHWKDFVTALVAHNKNSTTGHIGSWETWNEAYHTRGWNGTVAQMVRMAQDATAIIKAADPTALVATPSVVFCTQGINWMDSYLAAGGGQYADRIAFHGYVQRPGHTPIPEDFVSHLNSLKTVLAKYGQQEKWLWDTEASWGNTAFTGFTDKDMQAAFLARSYLLHGSSGVVRFYWYAWNDSVGTLWVPDPNDPSAPGTVLKPGVAFREV